MGIPAFFWLCIEIEGAKRITLPNVLQNLYDILPGLQGFLLPEDDSRKAYGKSWQTGPLIF